MATVIEMLESLNGSNITIISKVDDKVVCTPISAEHVATGIESLPGFVELLNDKLFVQLTTFNATNLFDQIFKISKDELCKQLSDKVGQPLGEVEMPSDGTKHDSEVDYLKRLKRISVIEADKAVGYVAAFIIKETGGVTKDGLPVMETYCLMKPTDAGLIDTEIKPAFGVRSLSKMKLINGTSVYSIDKVVAFDLIDKAPR